jgi:hypothetical protein
MGTSSLTLKVRAQHTASHEDRDAGPHGQDKLSHTLLRKALSLCRLPDYPYNMASLVGLSANAEAYLEEPPCSPCTLGKTLYYTTGRLYTRLHWKMSLMRNRTAESRQKIGFLSKHLH